MGREITLSYKNKYADIINLETLLDHHIMHAVGCVSKYKYYGIYYIIPLPDFIQFSLSVM